MSIHAELSGGACNAIIVIPLHTIAGLQLRDELQIVMSYAIYSSFQECFSFYVILVYKFFAYYCAHYNYEKSLCISFFYFILN